MSFLSRTSLRVICSLIMSCVSIGFVGCLNFDQFECFQERLGCAPTPDMERVFVLPEEAFDARRIGDHDQRHPPLDSSINDARVAHDMMLSQDSAPHPLDRAFDLQVIYQDMGILDQSLDHSIPDLDPVMEPVDMDASPLEDAMTHTTEDLRLSVEVGTRGWDTGYCQDVTIINISSETVEGWAIQMEVEGTLDHVWNADYTGNQGQVIFTHLDWNRVISPQGVYGFGFCALY